MRDEGFLSECIHSHYEVRGKVGGPEEREDK